MVRRLSLPGFVVLFSCSIVLAAAGRTAAQAMRSGTLAAGETTTDGALTMIVKGTMGSVDISLRNNDYRSIEIDDFTVSPSMFASCNGHRAVVRSDASFHVCHVFVPVVPQRYVPYTPSGPGARVPTPPPDGSLPTAAPVAVSTPEFVPHASVQISLRWRPMETNPKPSSVTPTPVPTAIPQVP